MAPDSVLRARLRTTIGSKLVPAVQRFHETHPEETGPDDLSEDMARNTLLFVEPLDRALCRATPSCVWGRDCDAIYGFIREHYRVPAAWPGDRDWTPRTDLVEPKTRVANAMGEFAVRLRTRVTTNGVGKA